MNSQVIQWIFCLFLRVIYASVFSAGFLLLFSGNLSATEWSLNSNLRMHYAYNDNIFLTEQPEDGVSNILIQPDIKFIAEEKSWKTILEARLRSNNYSDSSFDSDDQYYMVNGSYKRKRDTFSFKGSYDIKSSLDTESGDFGISTVRINRTTTNISPSYSYMLTERLQTSLSYTMMESKYDDSVDPAFVSYEVDMSSISLAYGLSEKNKLNASAQYTDYLSLNGLSEYQMLALRMGLSRQFSERFMASFMAGTSERDSISRDTRTIDDFFGTTVNLAPESVTSSSLVIDMNFNLKTEVGSVTGKLSRDNVTSSYGGVNEVNMISLAYKRKLSDHWNFDMNGKYEETESIISSTSFADRNSLYITTHINYSLDKDWKVTVSWRYTEREFITQNQSSVPNSNRLFVGMTYSSSKLSTF